MTQLLAGRFRNRWLCLISFPHILAALHPLFKDFGIFSMMWVSYTVILPFWVISEAPVLLRLSGDRYWGTKVQKNNHFTLSSSLFTHDVWSVKLPTSVIIFKMVRIPSVSSLAVDATCLKLFLHSCNINEENFGFIQLLCLYVSDHKIFRQVVSG